MEEAVNRFKTKDGEAAFRMEAADGGDQLAAHQLDVEKKLTKAEEIMDRYRNALQTLSE